MMRPKSLLAVLSILLLGGAGAVPEARPQGGGSYDALLALHAEFQEFRQPRVQAGVPDFTPATVDAQKGGLEKFQHRLRAIDPSGWPVSRQVDYHVVRAQLNDLEFSHRVVRPWARDPGHYVNLVRRAPHAELPVKGEDLGRVREQLGAVPRILDQARRNLSQASGELAQMAIRQLEQSDGINQGEPRRDVPPEGVIGWYRDFLERAGRQQPDLRPDAQQALEAVEGFRDWLREQAPRMTEPVFVGLENFDWYLRNVRLMPYTTDDLRVIGDREFNRGLTFLKIEQHRNRNRPPLEPARTAEDHDRRVREAEGHIRRFTREHDLMTFPGNLPPRFDTDAYWIERPEGRHFWEELTYRDPRNNHIHASIPGHRFDGIIQRAHDNPIRRSHRDGSRSEGWAFYIEEMYTQAGLLDELLRGRELFYIAQFKRAVRIPAELKMQTGEFTLQQAIDYMVEAVPLMEPNLARYDLEIYLRRPTAGMSYVMGKTQLEQLLSDRSLQLGEKFHLGRFHDEFLSAGPIPISLIRWEMTGQDDEIRRLWKPGS
jgi:uncharacterized protein (DUF885 family)